MKNGKLLIQALTLTLIAILCCESVQSQKRERSQREERGAQKIDAKELNAKQQKLCLRVLDVLDRADVVLSTARDGSKFKRSLNRLKPLVEDAEDDLPEGALKELLLYTAAGYTDVARMMVLGEQRDEHGASAIDDEAADFLSEVARRYKGVIASGSATDMLDPAVTAKVYANALASKKKLQRIVA